MKRSVLKLLSLVLVVAMATGAFGIVSAQGDTLNILYWQAPSILNPYLSTGTKDIDASALVLEPLALFDPDGGLVPVLAKEIPTIENGGFAEDLLSITWSLRDDIVWSDGSPFTAADVLLTGEYCMTPETGCTYASEFDGVVSIEAVDDYTVLITFESPKPFPYRAFVGNTNPILNAAQFGDCVGVNASSCSDQNFGPIGTGPFVVDEMRPNDVITYNANPNYRDADMGKPFFQRVVLKGGGDAVSAARAVLETGEADYAWNLQIAPAILNEMEAAGQGTVGSAIAATIERLIINQTNPDPSLGEEGRSIYMDGDNAHPFLTEPAVVQAMSMAIDRTLIADQLYGKGGLPTCNMINGPAIYVSPNNDDCLVQDIEGANALLDEAGIVDTDGDGIRENNGVPLSIVYQTSTNAVRQSTQALIKQWWGEIGIETELRNIDGAVFFGGDPASPDTHQKFYADVQEFASGLSPDPEPTFIRWVCDQMPTVENEWRGRNDPRYCNPEYDALFAEFAVTGNQDRRIELAIQLNDMLVDSTAMIPLIFRGSVSAYHNSIEGVWINGWDSEMWNVEDWTRSE